MFGRCIYFINRWNSIYQMNALSTKSMAKRKLWQISIKRSLHFHSFISLNGFHSNKSFSYAFLVVQCDLWIFIETILILTEQQEMKWISIVLLNGYTHSNSNHAKDCHIWQFVSPFCSKKTFFFFLFTLQFEILDLIIHTFYLAIRCECSFAFVRLINP